MFIFSCNEGCNTGCCSIWQILSRICGGEGTGVFAKLVIEEYCK